MSTIERTIVEIPISGLSGVEGRFSRETKINMDQIPKKYCDLTMRTKDLCYGKTQAIGVYQSIKIKDLLEDRVLLENGSILYGNFPPVLLKDSVELVALISTLKNSQELCEAEDNMMGRYFIDSWCSSIIESADTWLQNKIKDHVKKEGLYTTSAWFPGQHNFPLENQQVLFDILRPEDLDIKLSESFMMHPVKSVSGILGLTHSQDNRKLIPCNYCDLKENCPSRDRSKDCNQF